jgi:hypothetical protein
VAGAIAGASAVAYTSVRLGAPASTTTIVLLLALNVVLTAAAGALGAWAGSLARPKAPRGGSDARR